MLKFIGTFVIICIVFVLVGCANLIHIDSTPQNASIYYDGNYRGETPLTIKIVEHIGTLGEHLIEVRKDGYQTWQRRFVDVDDIFGNADDYPKNIRAELKRVE